MRSLLGQSDVPPAQSLNGLLPVAADDGVSAAVSGAVGARSPRIAGAGRQDYCGRGGEKAQPKLNGWRGLLDEAGLSSERVTDKARADLPSLRAGSFRIDF